MQSIETESLAVANSKPLAPGKNPNDTEELKASSPPVEPRDSGSSSGYAYPIVPSNASATISPPTVAATDVLDHQSASNRKPESLVGKWIEITGSGVGDPNMPGLTTKTKGICKVVKFEKAYNPMRSSKINSLHTCDFRLSTNGRVGEEEVLLFRKKLMSWNGGKTFIICNKEVVADFTRCEKLGFASKREYDKCLSLGFDEKSEYEKCIKLGLLDKAEFVEYSRSGFESVGAFRICKQAGFRSKDEYEAYKKSRIDSDESLEGGDEGAGTIWSETSLGSPGTPSDVPEPWLPTTVAHVENPARLVGRWIHVKVSRTGGTNMVGKVVAFQRKTWWKMFDFTIASMHTVDFSASGGGVELLVLERLRFCQHNQGDRYTLCSDQLSKQYEEAYIRGSGHPLSFDRFHSIDELCTVAEESEYAIGKVINDS